MYRSSVRKKLTADHLDKSVRNQQQLWPENDLPKLTADHLDKYVVVVLSELRQRFAEVAEAYADIFAKVRNE